MKWIFFTPHCYVLSLLLSAKLGGNLLTIFKVIAKIHVAYILVVVVYIQQQQINAFSLRNRATQRTSTLRNKIEFPRSGTVSKKQTVTTTIRLLRYLRQLVGMALATDAILELSQ